MIDVTDQDFQERVLEASKAHPVVVDLWAPWCGPCRQLGPILEGVIDATEGKVVLAKVNVDENPQISARFSVQSIPAVYAIKDAKAVDGFVGAQPRQFIENFVKGLLPSQADMLVALGDESSLRYALELEADHQGAIEALSELLVGKGAIDEAEELIKRIPETPRTRKLAAKCRLIRANLLSDDVSGQNNRDEIVANQVKSNGSLTKIESELEELLAKIPGDDSAKSQFLDILATLEPDDPIVVSYRKKLAAKIF